MQVPSDKLSVATVASEAAPSGRDELLVGISPPLSDGRTESLIAAFEHAFVQGERPLIDDFLQPPVQADLLLLLELIHVELELRIKAGDDAKVEEYLDRYPVLAENPATPLSLIHTEHRFRKRQGAEILSGHFACRFPHLKDQINALFAEDENSPTFGLIPLAGDSLLAATQASIVSLHNFKRAAQSPERTSYLFPALPRWACQALQPHFVEQEFNQGEHLMRQGAPGDSLMLLCSGRVEVHTQDQYGLKQLIAHAQPGDVIGEMALLTDEPRSAHVIAVTPVRVLVLPADVFHRVVSEQPRLAHVMTNLIATRLGHSDSDVLIGKTMAGYTIRARAGTGGMSIVYEADELATGCRVALKMMSHRLVWDAEALRLFEIEAAVVERFDHPGIIRLRGRFAAFSSYFLVLEFSDGETLAQWIKRAAPLSETTVRHTLRQVTAALMYAHARQVIHRDVKPSNIMLSRDGQAKLMDFGLALPIDELIGPQSQLVAGTLQYMAPEQLAGAALTPAADYYALGCVAYEMLTGERLLHRDLQLTQGRFGGWNVEQFRERCPQASDALVQWLDGCLQTDPARRRLGLEFLESNPS